MIYKNKTKNSMVLLNNVKVIIKKQFNKIEIKWLNYNYKLLLLPNKEINFKPT